MHYYCDLRPAVASCLHPAISLFLLVLRRSRDCGVQNAEEVIGIPGKNKYSLGICVLVILIRVNHYLSFIPCTRNYGRRFKCVDSIALDLTKELGAYISKMADTDKDDNENADCDYKILTGDENEEGEKADDEHLEGTKDSASSSIAEINESFKIVAAIDFGTTFSGYAYSFADDKEKIYTNKNWGQTQGFLLHKTPTCLLLKPDGEFVAFGFEAVSKYNDLTEEEADEYYYFDRFKMKLYDNKVSKTCLFVSMSVYLFLSVSFLPSFLPSFFPSFLPFFLPSFPAVLYFFVLSFTLSFNFTIIIIALKPV